MNVARANFVPQNANFGYVGKGRVAQTGSSGNEGGFGAIFATEMSTANNDLAHAWTGLGGDVLPHFGHQPRF